MFLLQVFFPLDAFSAWVTLIPYFTPLYHLYHCLQSLA